MNGARTRVVVGLLAAAIGLAACGGGRTTTTPTIPASHRLLLAALCDATAAARRGDAAKARMTFFDRAHQPIHELASATAAVDRAASARLLEAKQRVEADVGAAAPSLEVDLADTTLAAHAASVAVGDTTPLPCSPENP